MLARMSAEMITTAPSVCDRENLSSAVMGRFWRPVPLGALGVSRRWGNSLVGAGREDKRVASPYLLFTKT